MPTRTLIAAALLAVTPLSIADTLDFTNMTAWAGADGVNSFAPVSGVATLTSAGSAMTTNTGSSELTGCQNANSNVGAGLACGGDGIGIVDDEVSGGASESLTLTFAAATAVTSISFLDVFDEIPTEKVEFSFWDAGGNKIGLTESLLGVSSPGVNGGYVNWMSGSSSIAGVTSIKFFAPGSSANDFALARITYLSTDLDPVPLPAAAWLFGSALFGLVTVARRKQLKA